MMVLVLLLAIIGFALSLSNICSMFESDTTLMLDIN